jgi:hypothetical protein
MDLNFLLNKSAELRAIKKEIDIKQKEIALAKAKGESIVDGLEVDLDQSNRWINETQNDSLISCTNWTATTASNVFYYSTK